MEGVGEDLLLDGCVFAELEEVREELNLHERLRRPGTPICAVRDDTLTLLLNCQMIIQDPEDATGCTNVLGFGARHGRRRDARGRGHRLNQRDFGSTAPLS